MGDARIGSRLGRYELQAEIGHGGMSVVYRALDVQLQRLVAVKVMHPHLAEQPEARARFAREAVAVARLRHPHIIEIYDYGDQSFDRTYIVTELVKGAPLSAYLGGTALTPPEAALILCRPVQTERYPSGYSKVFWSSGS
jgi:serine/threonine protein kinase